MNVDQLKIAHIVHEYLPYSQTWIHRQVANIPAVDASVIAVRRCAPGAVAFPVSDLFVLSQRHPLQYLALQIGKPLGVRATSPAMRRRLSLKRPDCVHAHFGHVAWRHLPSVRAVGVPLVVSFYGHDMSELPRQSPVWKKRYAELFQDGTLFLCEGPAMAAGLEELGCPRSRIRIQRLGVDCAAIRAVDRLLSPGEPLRVLAAARFKEKKGIPDAIRAVALASRSADIRLEIVGGPASGREGRIESSRIASALVETGLGKRVTLRGPVHHAELIERMLASHVFLQPSRRSAAGDTEGGAPVVLIDAAATRMPAVSTFHADIPDVVLHGQTGLLANEGDVGELAAHLVSLYRNPEMLMQMGRNAAAHMEKKFDFPVCGASLVRHYREAIGKSVGGLRVSG